MVSVLILLLVGSYFKIPANLDKPSRTPRTVSMMNLKRKVLLGVPLLDKYFKSTIQIFNKCLINMSNVSKGSNKGIRRRSIDMFLLSVLLSLNFFLLASPVG